MEGYERLKRNSSRLRVVFEVLLVLTPVFAASFWLGVWAQDSDCLKHLPVKIAADLPMGSLLLGFFISMIPVMIIMYAILLIIRLFGLYEKGIVFASENVACYRGLGWSIIAYEIADFLMDIFLGIILTFHLGDGHRLLVIGVGNNDFYALLTGFSILTISWVMDEARKLKEENELII